MYYYTIAINCPKGEVLRPFFKKYRKLKIFVHFYDFYVRYGKKFTIIGLDGNNKCISNYCFFVHIDSKILFFINNILLMNVIDYMQTVL